MIGVNKLEISDAWMCEMVRSHLQEHVIKDNIIVTSVNKEFLGNSYRWVATIQPQENPSESKVSE